MNHITLNFEQTNSASVQQALAGQDVHVASPELLFTGDYERNGDDLILSKDGAQLIIEGYFNSSDPGNLVAPNGAFLDFDTVSAMAGPAAPGQYAQAVTVAGGSAQIGVVVKMTGTASNKHTDGVEVELAIGSPVFQGDVVATGPDSTLGISFSDGTLFSLSASSKMVLNELVYDADKAEDSSMVFNLVQGTFVFVAGQVAPNGNMSIETPVATMGIRGTTPKVVVDTNLGTGEFTILQDPDSGKVGSYVLIDKVTGNIIGSVESTGSKWLVTSLSQQAVEIGKSGIDLLEDQVALDQIRVLYSASIGDRTQIDGSNSFGQVAFNAISNNDGGDNGLGDGSDDGPGNQNQGAEGDAGDKDDPPIAANDAFAIDEDTILTGVNLIADNGSGVDFDPDGFALDVSQINGNNLVFVGGLASGLLPSGAILVVNPAGDITYDPNDVYDFLGLNDEDIQTFTYTINDPNDFTDTATVTITLTGRNDTPELTNLTTTILSDTITEAADTGNTAASQTADGNVTFTETDASDTHTAGSAVSSVTWDRNDTGPQSNAEVGGLQVVLTETAPNASPTLQFDATGTLISTPDPVTGDVVWTYTVTESDLDFLAENETLELIYSITVTDDSGVGAGGGTNEAAFASRDVTITITGTNDVPVITPVVVSGTVTDVDEAASVPPQNNAGDRTTDGSITFADADLTDRPVASEATKTVTWLADDGTTTIPLTAPQQAAIEAAFTISPDNVSGSNTNNGTITWDYTIAEGDIDFLGAGEQVKAVFTITITDDFGATDTQDVTITLLGADDDAPVITGVVVTGTVADVAEGSAVPPSANDGTKSAAGSITFADVDITDRPVATEATKSVVWLADDGTSVLSLTPAQQAAFEAAFTITPDGVSGSNTNQGTVNWNYDIAESDLDFLGKDETVTAIFTITVTDDEGNTDVQDIEITINGANDTPWITATTDIMETLPETEGASSTIGEFDVEDVDITDTVTVKEVNLVTGGTDTGVTAPTNAQLLSLFSPQSGVEIDNTQTTGTVNWTFDAGTDAFDYLGATESLILTYTVTVTDDNGAEVDQDVTITITGTNDIPIVSAADVTGGVIELGTPTGNLTDTGTLTFTDVDLTDVHIIDPTITASTGALGTLTASVTTDTTGSGTGGVITWNYSVAAADVEFLAKDQEKIETFTLTLDDQNGGTIDRTVTVTITGTNDIPDVATTDVTGGVTELVTPTGNITDTGTIAFTDDDLTDVHIVDPTITASTGALGTLTASVTTDTTGSGTGGVITWNYSVAAADVEFLAKDQEKVETFTLTLDDQNGGTIDRTVSVTITGTNDDPIVATTDVTGAVTELGAGVGNITDSGTIAFTDVDLTDVHIVDPTIVESTGALGTLTASVTTDTTGSGTGGVITWNYSVAAADVEFLAKDQEKVETFTLTLDDQNGGTIDRTVTVTITGTNDIPDVATTDVTGAVTELGAGVGNITDSGTIAFTDVDLTDVHIVDPTIVESTGALGTLTASVTTDTTGSGTGGVITWNYSVAAADVEFLAKDQEKVETFTLTLDDQNGGTIDRTVTVTITGTNDIPDVATTDVTGAVTELGAGVGNITDTGTIAFTDDDLTDVHIVDPTITASTGALGTLTASVTTDTTGSGTGGVITWNYSVAAADVEFLAKDQEKVETFTLTLDDQNGGTIDRTVTVTITGTNDIPDVATTDVTGGVTELVTPTGNITDTGTIAFTDDDLTDVHIVDPTITASTGALGTLTASVTTDTTGSGTGGVITWNYSVAAADVEFLAKDQEKVETFTLTLDDQNGGTIDRTVSVTITGTNDNPIVSAINAGTVTEDDAVQTINLLAGGQTDVDSNTTLSATNIVVTDNLGGSVTFTDNNDGTIDIDPDQFGSALNTGDSRTLTVNYEVSDGTIGTANTATLIVNGVDDNTAPVATDDQLSVPQDVLILAADFHLEHAGTNNDRLTAAKTGLDALGVFDNVDILDARAGQPGASPTLAAFDGYEVVLTWSNPGFADATLIGNLLKQYVDGGGGLVTAAHSHSAGAALGGNIVADLPLGSGAANGANGDLIVQVPGDVIFNGINITTFNTEQSFFTGSAALAPGATLLATMTTGSNVIARNADGDIISALFYPGFLPSHPETAKLFGNMLLDVAGPSVLADEQTITTIQVADLLANDNDTDGHAVSIASVSATSAQGAVLTLNSGEINYDPTNAAAIRALRGGQELSDTFTYTISDGNGGTDTATVTLTVAGVSVANTAPVVTAGATLSYVHNAGAQVIDNTVTISDVDNASLVGATVSITNNFDSTGDFLGFVNQSGITGTYNGATGELELTGIATLAEYQTALRSVTFQNNATTPNTMDREISFSVDDGNDDSTIVTSTITLPNYTTTPGADATGNFLVGDANDNIVNGLAGDDDLNGGDGNDKIIGGEGQDLLSGGAGKDVFVMLDTTDGTLEVDDILDFDILNDSINLADLLSGGFDPNDPGSEITFNQPGGTGTDLFVAVDSTDLFGVVNSTDIATLGGVSFGDTISVIHDEAQAAIAVAVSMGIS